MNFPSVPQLGLHNHEEQPHRASTCSIAINIDKPILQLTKFNQVTQTIHVKW